MASETFWFSNPDTLLEEVQRGEHARRRPLAIDGYDDLHEWRRGGQGIVYRGVQRSTRRPVAVKVVLEGAFASKSSRHRFEREIDVVAALRHPNIVSIYDSGTTADDRLYCVMEFVDGFPFDEYVRTRLAPGRDPSVRRKLELWLKVCDAVQYANQGGVIHRDLKPSNIRVDQAGEPRVLDFGLAKATAENLLTGAATGWESQPGQFIGSLAWASPEQAEGASSRIDIRTDVYSLGVILYYTLVQEFPYAVSGSVRDTLDNILHAEPRRPGAISSDLDSEIDTILLKCLSKIPDRRYQSVGELANDVRRYLDGEPIEARRDSAWYVLRKSLRRYWMAAAAVGVFVVLVVAFGVTMSVLYNRALKAEQLAETRFAETRQEADKATAINDFLNDMLLSVDAEREGYEVKVADVLGLASSLINRRFEEHPEIRASLLDTIGTSYQSLGRYDDAKRLLRESLGVLRETHGDRHPHTLGGMSRLGVALLYQGSIEQAESIITEALSKARETLGPDDPATLAIQANLALVRREQGRSDEAVELATETLAAQRRVLGGNHRETLSTLRALGWFLHEQGNLAEAEAVLREAYQRCGEVLGEEHPDTLTAVNNLALLLDYQRRSAEAEVLYRRAVEGQTILRGADHPETLTALNNLASAMQHQGHFGDAEVLCRRVLETRRRALGNEHSATLSSLHNLARMLHEQKKFDQAEPLMREAVETLRRVCGEQHPHAIQALGSLAGLLGDMGRMDEGQELCSKALELYRNTVGDEHPSTIIEMNNLAGFYRDQGRYDEAIALYSQVLELSPRVLPEGHWLVHVFRCSLGHCLTKIGRYEEAERELGGAYAGLGDEHEKSGIVIERLAELYDAWGKPAKAAEYHAKLQPTSP